MAYRPFSLGRFVAPLQKCLNKQATVDDDPTGIRWINNDLIGLKRSPTCVMLKFVNSNRRPLRLSSRVITKRKSQITVLNDVTRKSRALGGQFPYAKKTVKCDEEHRRKKRTLICRRVRKTKRAK